MSTVTSAQRVDSPDAPGTAASSRLDSGPVSHRLGGIRRGLAWTLGVDLSGTAVYIVVALWTIGAGHPESSHYLGLAVVAAVGVAGATVAVALSRSTLLKPVPSRPILWASAVATASGLPLNTAGVVFVMIEWPPVQPMPAVVLLLAGGVLSAIYAVLIITALRGPEVALARATSAGHVGREV